MKEPEHKLRCSWCFEEWLLDMVRFSCPNGCLGSVYAVADCRDANTQADIGKFFADIEMLDMTVKEAIMRPKVVSDMMGGNAMEGDNMSDARIWGAEIRLGAPNGRMVIWDEELIGC